MPTIIIIIPIRETVVEKDNSEKNGKKYLPGLSCFNNRKLGRVVLNHIGGFEEEQGCGNPGEQRNQEGLENLSGTGHAGMNAGVDTAENPEKHAAQRHAENSLKSGELITACSHHFPVDKRIRESGNHNAKCSSGNAAKVYFRYPC
ncbi:MAG: hypothetical protein PUB75_06960 [Firmicutes bacterium]|nr:hypothetical protein [Bacillota bacterium]